MRVSFKCIIFLIFFLVCFQSHALSSEAPFDGPFQIKNLFPLFLHANQPYLEKAALENSLSFTLSHSSTYTVQESGDWTIHLDMEITELNLRYKRIINNNFEFDFDIPVLIIGAGFMDGFIEDYHHAFGFPGYGRSNRPKNEFLYEVRKDGDLIIRGKSGVKPGDIRLSLKKSLISSDNLNLSIKGSVEIPLSSARQGFSNGNIDGSLSVALDKRISDRTITYWNVGAVFPGNVKGHEDLNMKNFFYGGAAAETHLIKDLFLIVQVLGQSKIYPTTDLEAVDRAAVLLAVGGRYHTGKGALDLSLTEDLSQSGVPDFILNLSYKKHI